jgi:putative hemolysin
VSERKENGEEKKGVSERDESGDGIKKGGSGSMKEREQGEVNGCQVCEDDEVENNGVRCRAHTQTHAVNITNTTI